ncbi:hypothetical protein RFZ33_11395, partial [Acinetobacter baumannii]|nr:hypothetical protein [Acinetobacter baumannii]
GSKELKSFFTNYVNYYINEKKENIIEVVENFLDVEMMQHFERIEQARKLERFFNDKFLVLQMKKEAIV